MNLIHKDGEEVGYVYFIDSSAFEEGFVKMVVSRVRAEDLIEAHRNVYEESSVLPNSLAQKPLDFTIRTQLVLFDMPFFMKCLEVYRKSLHMSNSDTFYREAHVTKLEELVNAANALTELVRNQVDPNVEHVDLKVSAFANMQNVEYGCYDTLMSEEARWTESALDIVPVTSMLELRLRTEVPRLPATANETLKPKYKEFIVFNKGYRYNTCIFKEAFPEFNVTEHDGLPKNELAEEMLWFLSRRRGLLRIETAQMVKKIRAFFDCSTAACPVPGNLKDIDDALLWNNGHKPRVQTGDLRGHP